MTTNNKWRDVKVYEGWSMGAESFSDTIAKWDVVPASPGGQRFPSIFSHQFWCFDFDSGPAWICESLMSKGVRFTPFSNLIRAIDDGRVAYAFLARADLDGAQAVRLFDACRSLDGKSYDHFAILCLMLWLRFRDERPPWLAWGLYNDRYWCSELVAATGMLVGYDICGDAATLQTVTPNRSFARRYNVPSSIAFGQDLPSGRLLTEADMRFPQPVT